MIKLYKDAKKLISEMIEDDELVRYHGDLEDLMTFINNQRLEISDLEDEVDDLENSVEDFESEISDLKDEIVELQENTSIIKVNNLYEREKLLILEELFNLDLKTLEDIKNKNV